MNVDILKDAKSKLTKHDSKHACVYNRPVCVVI